MGYLNIPAMVEQCHSASHCEATDYDGKSGQETLYRVTVETNPIEFVHEFAYNCPEFEQLGLLYGNPDDPDAVYVFRVIGDLFWYLLFHDYLGPNDMPQTLEPKVVRVVNYLKEKSLVFNWNFYFNEFDVEYFREIIEMLEKNDA